MGKLDDPFAEVRLVRLNAMLGKMLVQMDLFGCHGLGLDDLLDALFFAEIRDVVLDSFGAVCPEYFDATGFCGFFKLFGKLIEMVCCAALDLGDLVPERLKINAFVCLGTGGRVIPSVENAGEVLPLKGFVY